jgi:hypothetical protein
MDSLPLLDVLVVHAGRLRSFDFSGCAIGARHKLFAVDFVWNIGSFGCMGMFI